MTLLASTVAAVLIMLGLPVLVALTWPSARAWEARRRARAAAYRAGHDAPWYVPRHGGSGTSWRS